jgi:hypothetical protein
MRLDLLFGCLIIARTYLASFPCPAVVVLAATPPSPTTLFTAFLPFMISKKHY